MDYSIRQFFELGNYLVRSGERDKVPPQQPAIAAVTPGRFLPESAKSRCVSASFLNKTDRFQHHSIIRNHFPKGVFKARDRPSESL